MYYNISTNFWEPFIEKTDVKIEIQSVSQMQQVGSLSQSIKVCIPTILNINISDSLIHMISCMLNIYQEKNQINDSLRIEFSERVQMQLLKSADINTDNMIENRRRSSNKKRKDLKNGIKKKQYEEYFDKDLVSPCTIINKSCMEIHLESMHTNYNLPSNTISANQTTDILISYQEFLDNMLKEPDLFVQLTATKYKIFFSEPSYGVVNNININTAYSCIHKIKEGLRESAKEENSYLIISVETWKMRKILFVRTPCRIINNLVHGIRTTYLDGEKEEHT